MGPSTRDDGGQALLVIGVGESVGAFQSSQPQIGEDSLDALRVIQGRRSGLQRGIPR